MGEEPDGTDSVGQALLGQSLVGPEGGETTRKPDVDPSSEAETGQVSRRARGRINSMRLSLPHALALIAAAALAACTAQGPEPGEPFVVGNTGNSDVPAYVGGADAGGDIGRVAEVLRSVKLDEFFDGPFEVAVGTKGGVTLILTGKPNGPIQLVVVPDGNDALARAVTFEPGEDSVEVGFDSAVNELAFTATSGDRVAKGKASAAQARELESTGDQFAAMDM